MTGKKKLLILLSVILVLVLTAAAALIYKSINDRKKNAESEKRYPLTVTDNDGKVTENDICAEADTVGAALSEQKVAEGEKKFTLTVTDYDGKVTEYDIRTKADTVGAALSEQKIVEGEDGPYGLYIKTVNGIRADYELDGHYWAFYVNGEYAVAGIDQTVIEPGAVYGLKVE